MNLAHQTPAKELNFGPQLHFGVILLLLLTFGALSGGAPA